jgi:hypothetical protein
VQLCFLFSLSQVFPLQAVAGGNLSSLWVGASEIVMTFQEVLLPSRPVPTFSPRPRPTIQPRPPVIPSPNASSLDQLEIQRVANTAALNYLLYSVSLSSEALTEPRKLVILEFLCASSDWKTLYQNDQATFTDLKVVAEQEALKEAARRGVIISSAGFGTIAATYALNEKARRG